MILSASSTAATLAQMRREFDAAKGLLEAHSQQINALSGFVDAISELGNLRQKEVVVLRGVVAALIAELAGRSKDPLTDLSSTISRINLAILEHVEPTDSGQELGSEISALISAYAEQYITREL